jgi:hypothetical protein
LDAADKDRHGWQIRAIEVESAALRGLPGESFINYSKRALALDQVEVMAALGHDRGARVTSPQKARRQSHRQAAFAQIEFATDSPLEGDGFEPSVPRSPVSSVGAACRFNGGRDAVEAHRPGGQIT